MIKKVKKIIVSNIKYFVFFFLTILFIGMITYVFKKTIIGIDNLFYSYIVESIRNKRLTQIMKVITMMGSSIAIIVFCIISLILVKDKKKGVLIFINPLLAVCINQALKFIVARKRPTEFFLIVEKGFSFPSGHSMVSVAFYGFIIYLIYTNFKGKKKYIVICLILILIILIMFSRIYLGVHYLSDVVAGSLISISFLITYIKVFRTYIKGVLDEK